MKAISPLPGWRIDELDDMLATARQLGHDTYRS
jgi:hypothetical protein